MEVYRFKTIASPSESKLTEKNSRFLAYAYPIQSEETAQNYLNQLRDEHPKANHHCYALRLGVDGDLYRANDDGEPTGSAGRPILGQIDSFELTDVLIVVVRYFGGVKLGVSGLIKAYKASARLALEEASIIEKELTVELTQYINYAQVNDFLEWVNQNQLTISNQVYDDGGGHFTLVLPMSTAESIKLEISNRFG